MIYLTGDTHRDFSRFDKDIFPEQRELTKNDYVIILGDFGGVWESNFHKKNYMEILEKDFDWSKEPVSEKMILDALEKKNYTTLFVTGNHENYDRLATYPDKEWHGGVVKEIRPSVLLLKRGYVFDIEGYKCFTMGGARSHDIWGGVFDLDDPDFNRKRARAERAYEPYRINHLSWWKEELPSDEEMQRAMDTLKANDWKVDFVFTHEAPASDLALISRMYKPDEYSRFLESIRQSLDYKHWFFGHYHDDRNITDKEHLLYHQITPITFKLSPETSAFSN